MSEQPDEIERVKRDEETTARLMQLAGPRADIPEPTESRVYKRVLQEWNAENENAAGSRVYQDVHRSFRKGAIRGQVRRWAAPMAVAASAALVAFFVMQPDTATVPAIGSIVKIAGPRHDEYVFALDDKLFPGMTLSTGDGQGLSILLARNESLRVGENSALRIDAGDQFTLLQGRVYVDTGQSVYRDGSVSIDAGFATVTDIGTQFAVDLDGSTLGVAVREGRVDVQRDTKVFVAIAGEKLRVGKTGDADSDTISPNAAYWQWASDLAPNYDTENKSVMDILNWATREAGLKLDFESDELRMAAMRADLHGPVSDLTPLEAVESALATTTFRYEIDAGRVLVKR